MKKGTTNKFKGGLFSKEIIHKLILWSILGDGVSSLLRWACLVTCTCICFMLYKMLIVLQSLERRDIVVGIVTSVIDSGLVISLLCMDNGKARDIDELKISVSWSECLITNNVTWNDMFLSDFSIRSFDETYFLYGCYMVWVLKKMILYIYFKSVCVSWITQIIIEGNLTQFYSMH